MARRFYSREALEDTGSIYWVMIFFISLSIILMMTQSANVRSRGPAQSFADDTVSPLTNIAFKPISMLETFFGTLEDRQRAFEENIALRRELQILRDDKKYVASLENKIAKYETILNVSYDIDTPIEKIAARAVSDIEGPFVRGLLVNAGEKQGVEKGDAIMTTQGMAGHVISVGRTSARVLRIDDLNSRIPVISERSQSVAILAGNNNDYPKLTFVGRGEDWQIGDRVLTSGDEGLLPRGLYIGEVVAFDGEAYHMRPDGLQNSIDWVFIPKFPKLANPDLDAGEIDLGLTEEGELILDSEALDNALTTNQGGSTNQDGPSGATSGEGPSPTNSGEASDE